jgi:tRNA G18 (ribose-2'-O)-methylase SpoU
VLISDPEDSRIADYRQIRERDLVGRRGLFVAEGAVVLRGLVESPAFEPVSFLIAEPRAQALSPILQLAGAAPVYLASQQVMDAVAGFSIHRGVLAIGRRRQAVDDVGALIAGLPQSARVLVAFGIGNHDNMGGLFRNAAAFGVDAVLLDETSCDPLYRKALRVSVGAALRTPWARGGSQAQTLRALAAAGFDLLALSPAGEESVGQVSPAPRMALIVGAEGPGLPEAVLARCRRVRIPMAAGFDSLNVATAAAVALSRLGPEA